MTKRNRTKRALISLSPLILIFFYLGFAFSERPIPKAQGPVNDFANVIPAPYENKMTQIVSELLRKTQIPIVIVTMPDIGGAEYNDYATRIYETWGIGKKGEDKGVLIFLTVKERKMRIETGYGVEGILPDGLVGEIRDKYMMPFLKEDKYGEGILNGTMAVALVIAKSSGIQLTVQEPLKAPKTKRSSGLSFLPLLLIFLFFIFTGRGRRGSWLWFLLLLMGGGGPRSGHGGSFGGFGGGFGGFGGGMSGGGGAGGSF